MYEIKIISFSHFVLVNILSVDLFTLPCALSTDPCWHKCPCFDLLIYRVILSDKCRVWHVLPGH